MFIDYKIGDATHPIGDGNKIIVHVCNDVGAWGKGFVMALSAKWNEPESQYRLWSKSDDNFRLGEVRFVKVEADIWVANLVGQRNIRPDKTGIPPIRYEAVKAGLSKVREFAAEIAATVHMPRIGSGLAGGKWQVIESIIDEELVQHNITVRVYDLA